MRRRYHPDVDGLRGRAPDGLNLPLLKDPKQLDLHVGRHIANLIQEQGAAMGQLKAPKAICKRPRKGPLSMTKKLALEEVSGNRAAVNGNEGRIGPSTLCMN